MRTVRTPVHVREAAHHAKKFGSWMTGDPPADCAAERGSSATRSRANDRLVVMAAVVTPDAARWFTQHLRARAASLLAEYWVAAGFEHNLLRGLQREAADPQVLA